MPFSFVCPHCRLETLVDDEFSGQSGACAGCGKIIVVPPTTSLRSHEGHPVANARSSWLPVAFIAAASLAAALFVFGVAVWLLFPAIQGVSASVQKISCRSNLERIAAALRQYELDHGTLPPAYLTDSTGKPMHSWRILILPQLGLQGLQDRYSFNEPWDGPNNLQLIPQMPELFGCPADPDARRKGETSYMVLVGPGTLFPGMTAIRSGQVRDDRALTILVAETPVAGVAWTQPKDLDATRMKFAINGAVSGEVGSLHSGGANVITANGTVHFVSELFPDEYLQAMSTANGGEDVPLEALE